MSAREYSGVFIGEGSSDMPISDIVVDLFFDRDVSIRLSKPDFGLLKAADETGRRRERMAKRFNQNRRQLLEQLDRSGPVTKLKSWQRLTSDIDDITSRWTTG